MDWDDIRFYLAVARHGSIRAASQNLGVNPSTVSRRVDAYEKKIGVRLFERLPTGYLLTKIGQDMMDSAELIENEIASLDRRVIGRDAELNGKLRVTLPGPLATHLLMQDFADFEKEYPGINIELHSSFDVMNLSKREADVAIRITDDPAENLIGKVVGAMSFSTYAARHYLNQHDYKSNPTSLHWIQHRKSIEDNEWLANSRYAKNPVRHVIGDPALMFEAAQAGMGMAKLPCFMGDSSPVLERIDNIEKTACGSIWLLSHKDLRSTARVRVFVEFMSEAFKQHQALLSGNAVTNAQNVWQARTHIA